MTVPLNDRNLFSQKLTVNVTDRYSLETRSKESQLRLVSEEFYVKDYTSDFVKGKSNHFEVIEFKLELKSNILILYYIRTIFRSLYSNITKSHIRIEISNWWLIYTKWIELLKSRKMWVKSSLWRRTNREKSSSIWRPATISTILKFRWFFN